MRATATALAMAAPAPAALSILDCMQDPELFARLFRGESWTAWKVFLAALFALPMDADALAVFQHHTGRVTAPQAAFSEAALVVGRRGGKSRVVALIAVFLAVFRDYRDRLAPGEAATVAVIAADRKQARSVMRFMTGMFTAVPLLQGMISAQTAESLTLSNGVVIEIHTASFRVTRGYSLVAAICDEVAFWRSDDGSANPAEEILRALRPGLSNLRGLLLMASSPYDKRGPLFKAHKRYYGVDDGRVLVWQGTTAEMNPLIDPALIAEAYEEDPANAAAEFGAQFRDDIAAFVTREIVDACTVRNRHELVSTRGFNYHAFCDPSGGSSDSMTLAIAHKHGEKTIVDALRECKPPFSPEAVVAEFARLLKSFGLSKVHGDRYAGLWPRERFQVHGIKYETSDRPKSDIYKDTLPLLNSRTVELLDMPRLANQLCDLERRTARGGRDSIDHPPGGHDDLANSAMGALLLASERGPQPARFVRVNLMGRIIFWGFLLHGVIASC